MKPVIITVNEGLNTWLWKLLCQRVPVTRQEYSEAFEHRTLNMVWRSKELNGRVVLLFGDEVRRVAGVGKEFVYPIVQDGVTYRQLPHPSGWYERPGHMQLASLLMEELYNLSRGEAHACN